jgi:hypothetical protein
MAPQDHPQEHCEGRFSIAAIELGFDVVRSKVAGPTTGSVRSIVARKASGTPLLRR